MSAAFVGIVYRADTMQITRVIVPDTDYSLARHTLNNNELMVRMPAGIFQTMGGLTDVASYLGLSV